MTGNRSSGRSARPAPGDAAAGGTGLPRLEERAKTMYYEIRVRGRLSGALLGGRTSLQKT